MYYKRDSCLFGEGGLLHLMQQSPTFWHQGLILWETIFPRMGWEEDFRMIQARYISRALWFYYYCISSYSNHWVLDLRGWGPLTGYPQARSTEKLPWGRTLAKEREFIELMCFCLLPHWAKFTAWDINSLALVVCIIWPLWQLCGKPDIILLGFSWVQEVFEEPGSPRLWLFLWLWFGWKYSESDCCEANRRQSMGQERPWGYVRGKYFQIKNKVIYIWYIHNLIHKNLFQINSSF